MTNGTLATPETQTQTKRILRHLLDIGPINPLQALNLYGCFRLGARIWDLTQVGIKIESNRNPKPKYAIYRLEPGSENWINANTYYNTIK